MDINIAICDDDTDFLKSMKSILVPYIWGSRHEIHLDLYSAAGDLISAMRSGKEYRIFFLDVEIADHNGIDLARDAIDRLSFDPYVIFISNYPEYMKDSFSVHPYQYLQKPVDKDAVYGLLDEIIGKEEEKYISLTVLNSEDNEQIPVSIMDILYIETSDARQQKLTFHLYDRKIVARGILTAWQEKLTGYPFSLCYKGILVNVFHIHYINSGMAVLRNGEEVPVSRRYLAKLKNEMVNSINTYLIRDSSGRD